MKKKILITLLVLAAFFAMQSCCNPSEVVGSVNNTLRPQQTNNWCWAATTQMIAQAEGITVQQCDLANHRFGKTNCCEPNQTGSNCPKTADCNTPGWLELDFAGLNFSQSETALSWLDLRKEIYCRKNVLGFAYGTSGIVGHVVAVKGYMQVGDTRYVVLNDPWSPCEGSERLITYEEYVDPVGTATHWATFYGTSKK